jgi:trans-aconitate methyltransferase
MGCFEVGKNVDEYIRMAHGYDGRELIAVLRKHLPAGSTVLELGMGPGKDLDLLAETYTATGSDSSRVFLRRHRERHPAADLLRLDAATIDTDRTFDCIYSNKVLIHLSRPDFRRSFDRQKALLNSAGLLMRSFWRGEGEEVHRGLLFVYHSEAELLNGAGTGLEVVAVERYA